MENTITIAEEQNVQNEELISNVRIKINAEEHLGLVRSVVSKFVDRNVPIEDTEEYADGVMGLLAAVEGFIPEKHFQFSTYAIKSIHQALIQGWRQKNRKKRKGVLCSIDDNNIDLMEENDTIPNVAEILAKFFEPHPEDTESDIRNKYVLKEHFLNERTLRDIGEELQISKQRIKQLCEHGLNLLRQRFKVDEASSLHEFCLDLNLD